MKVDKITFKECCDNFISEVKTDKCGRVNNLQVYLQKEYGLTTNAICKRFNSYYGTTITKLYGQLVLPTKNELVVAISVNDNWTDVVKCLKLNKHYSKGLLDRYFGCSSFAKAKALVCLDIKDINFDPSISNNKALVISQFIGDGHYCSTRGALTIQHGDKQENYLAYKVGLFNKAFPTSKSVSNIKNHTHAQGHKYSSWYSGRLPSKLTTYLESKEEYEMVPDLTPFGILLLFLDDGYFDLDFNKRGNTYISIYIHNTKTLNALREELKTYQVETTVSSNVIKIGTYQSAVNFYKNFIEHYLSDIPECMKYKIEMKI